MKRNLNWPREVAKSRNSSTQWQHSGSNICLDFHGDPLNAQLTIFSDGNHHMALQETLELFLHQNPDVVDIFYATTPPNILISYLENGGFQLGNLHLSRLPHVFISPENVMRNLVNQGFINNYQTFMQSNGNVLLVSKGNPKNIVGVADLLRDDVRLFISNPQTEISSYDVYRNSIMGIGEKEGRDERLLQSKLEQSCTTTRFGELIHHREAPQVLYEDNADVAMVYYHLALRYTRIFPDKFDFVPLGGSKEKPEPAPANVTTTYHVGLLKESGDWGQLFLDFLFSESATDIYTSHGLRRPT